MTLHWSRFLICKVSKEKVVYALVIRDFMTNPFFSPNL